MECSNCNCNIYVPSTNCARCGSRVIYNKITKVTKFQQNPEQTRTTAYLLGGGCVSIPNAYIPSTHNLPHNGVAVLSPEEASSQSGSEGQDLPNYIFNQGIE